MFESLFFYKNKIFIFCVVKENHKSETNIEQQSVNK